MFFEDSDFDEDIDDRDIEEDDEDIVAMSTDDFYGEDEDSEFADPTGVSALRAASSSNPRNLPCPTCGRSNRLTPKDKALGYQCDTCANRAESGMDY